jgi:hypothetical protein
MTQSVEFRRDSGEGGAAQRWIDDNLPTCPLCKSQSLWETAEETDQQALVRWAFRCSNCKAVLSTIPDFSASARSFPVPAVRTAVTKDVRIDSVERKEDEDFLGEEFPLAELQEWASENET